MGKFLQLPGGSWRTLVNRCASGVLAVLLSGAAFASPQPAEGLSADLPLQLYTEELPPLNFLEEGRARGLSVDIVREIQRRLDDSTPIQVVPWARGYRALQERPNVALFSTARSAEREPRFQWVGPLADLDFTLFVRADSPLDVANLDAARQLGTIATYRDDVREQFLRR